MMEKLHKHKNQKILVTGAAGFIGMHTVINLNKCEDCEVVGLDNLNDYYSIDLKFARLEQTGVFDKAFAHGNLVNSSKSSYRFVKMSLQDKQPITELFAKEKFDYVIHLAAQAGVRHSLVDPDSYVESNIVGFINILEACRYFDVKHLVYASSSSVYGLNTRLPFQEDHLTDHPASLYAATKKSNELMAHSYSHLFKLPTTGLRFFTVYGPWGRPDMAMFLFTRAILNNKPIQVFNEGKMVRDFTYIDDIVSAIIELIFKPAIPNPDWNSNNADSASSSAPYRIFNIGNSDPIPLMEYIEAIETTLNIKAIKEFLPLQSGDIVATHSDTTRLESYIRYLPMISVQQGVEQFVSWYIEYFKVREKSIKIGLTV